MHLEKDKQQKKIKIEKTDVIALIIAGLEIVLPLALILIGCLTLVLLFITKVLMR